MNNSEIKLYIVNKDDSIENICERFNSTKEDLFRMNPLIKNKSLYQGQPLNVLCNTKIPEIRAKNSLFNQEYLIQLCYSMKEMINSKSFYPNAFEILYKNSIPLYVLIFQENRIVTIESLNEFTNLFKKLHEHLLQSIDILKKKATDELKSHQEKIKEIKNSITSTIKKWKLDSSEQIENFVKNISEKWQLYMIQILTLKFKDSEDLFKDILNNYNSLSTMII